MPPPWFAAARLARTLRWTVALGLVASSAPLVAQDELPREEEFAALLPRISVRSPQESLAAMTVMEGFEVQLVACEPDVADPVAIAFDAGGSAYVVEMRGYSEQADELLGRVRRLEDRDGDGVYERSTVFLEGLSWPTAILCWDGGAFVAESGSLWFARDDDGDGQADTREVVYAGFRRGNVQGLINSLRWGPDQRVWGCVSSSGARLLRPGEPASSALELRGRDFAFDPRSRVVEAVSGGAQHGACFDDAGRRFLCSNSDHLQLVVYEDRYLRRRAPSRVPSPRVSIAADGPQAEVFRVSEVEPWRVLRTQLRVAGAVPGPVEGGGRAAGYFTGATGVTVYRGDAWAEEFRGQVFIGDVGSNLVHRKHLEAEGVLFRGVRADLGREFLASSDVWFRPVQFANAPDGTLWILDMAREVIEHPDSLPPSIKRHLDLSSGRDRGRLWRVAAAGSTPRPAPRLDQLSTDELVTMLAHPNAWHRETADRLLYERRDPAAHAPLRRAVRDPSSALGRLHALSSLAGLGALREEELLHALEDPDPWVRERAVLVSERLEPRSAAFPTALARRVDDPAPRVRFQLAFTLGEMDDELSERTWLDLLARDGGDAWMRFALATSQTGSPWKRLRSLVDRADPHACELAASLIEPGAEEDTQADLLEALRELARTRIGDSTCDARERAGAARILGRSIEISELIRWITPREPRELQLAVLSELARDGREEFATAIVDRWGAASPGVRAPMLDALASRALWAHRLIDALESGRIPVGRIGRPFLAALVAHPDGAVRERTRALAKIPVVAPTERRIEEVLALRGEPQAGRALFRDRCAACHRLENHGVEVGPQLRAMAERGPAVLLRHILEPNAEVQPAFENYVVFTKDGRTLSGLIQAETAVSIELRRGEGVTDTVARAEIDELRASGKSLMPEGLHEDLGAQQLADLVAYLRTAQ